MSQVQVQPLFRRRGGGQVDLDDSTDSFEGDSKEETKIRQRKRPKVDQITDIEDDYDAWYSAGGEKTTSARKKLPKRASSSDLRDKHHRQADFPRARLAQLDVATDEQASAHPHLSRRPVNVFLFVLIKKLRGINPKHANADISFILNLRWRVPGLQGKRIDDMSKLWTPKIGIINEDRLTMKREIPWFYPDTGDVRLIVHCDGTVANESDLRTFPFDYDSLRIKIAAEIGTGDRYVRLMWQSDRLASAITPKQVGTQNMERDLVPGGNAVVRFPRRENVTGYFTAIEVQLRLTRRYGFYLWKIMLLVWMIACMSWSTFLVRSEDGRIDPEAFIERLNFTAALLLAAVSFLYISQESIPRLSYLTSLDTMILFSFFNLFGVMVETVAVRIMSTMSVSPEVDGIKNYTFTIKQLETVDTWGMYISAGTFHLVEFIIPIYALGHRWRWLRRVKKNGPQGYLDPGLLKMTGEAERASREKNSSNKTNPSDTKSIHAEAVEHRRPSVANPDAEATETGWAL